MKKGNFNLSAIVLCIVLIMVIITACDNGAFGGNNSTASNNKYVDGRDFSDGVAWVQTSERVWHCVEKSGNIILKLNSGESPLSNFSQGVAVVKRNDNTIELIDKAGDVISSPKSGEYDEIISFIHELGMIVVYRHVNTFQLTENQCGVIDNNGNWVARLHKNDILFSLRGESEFLAPHIGNGYIKERIQIYRSHNYINQPFLYNIFTSSINEVPFNHLYDGRVVLGWETVRNFENRYGVFRDKVGDTKSNGSIFSIDSEGKVTEIIKNVIHQASKYRNGSWFYCESSIGEYKEGLFYFSDKEFKDGNDVIANGRNQGFYDINGNQAINLFNYDIKRGNRVAFSGGYCLLLLGNPQGTSFYTIIDKVGNQMFEPRLVEFREIYTELKDGMVVLRNENGSKTIINFSGEIIAEFNSSFSISDYNEDVAMVRGDGEVYYIDKTGQRLF